MAGIEGVEVCGQASDAREARLLTERLAPDLVVLDLMLGDGDGLTLIRELRQLRRDLVVFVLTMLDPREYERRARAAGAAAYLKKTTGLAELSREMWRLLFDGAVAGGEVRGPVSDVACLSDRELRVFQMLGKGRSSREIGGALGISPRTVDTHRDNIRRKLREENARSLLLRAAAWMRSQGIG